jgi:hypothetical protein
MSTKPRIADPTFPVRAEDLAALEAAFAPLDAVLATAIKDGPLDRRAPEECTFVRRSGNSFRGFILKLLDVARQPAQPARRSNGRLARW